MSFLSAAPGIHEVEVSDLGPLAWVLDELRKSLDGATKAIRRFVRDAEMARGSDISELDASHLRIARQQLHQAVGALEMVGMEAPAKMLRAMEALAQKFVQRPELCSDHAANAVEKASFALVEYLEGVLKGKKASSVALFPQFRVVQELAGAERVHPADLWPYSWRWISVPVPAGVVALDYAPNLRSQMDRAVLKLVKTGDTAGAERLAGVCAGLSAGETSVEARAFWMIAAGFFEVMALELAPGDGFTKRAASRVLQQYATLAKGARELSDRLAQDLLFFCSLAAPHAPESVPSLTAVRHAYGLQQDNPIDYESEQFGRFDPALLVLARKRIASAAETWSGLAGGDTHRIKVASEQFAALADSMVKLHAESGALAQALTDAIDVTVRSGAAPTPAVAMEVATSVLYLEAAYEDLDPTDSHMAERGARLAQRLAHVTVGGQPEPLESWMEELYRRVSDRQTMGSVVDELRTTLASVEKSLDQFFRNPADQSPLREVPSQLSQMRGVFSVLGLDQPSLAALRMRSTVEQFLVDDAGASAEKTAAFEKLGVNLGAMGFLIDMLSYQRALAKKLFVYDEETGEFKPLMGRERAVPPLVGAGPEVIADVVVAPISGPAVVQQESLPAAPVASQAAVQDDATDDDTELLDIFLEEAREVVQNGLTAIKALAADPTDLAEQTTLRRSFHTLKGSSRMVGLNDFGEAAWSFEQMLNASLAEQRPASDDLITLSASAMAAFARWVKDIAGNTGTVWNPQDFRQSSDGLRLSGTLIPLRTPGAAMEEALPGYPVEAVEAQPMASFDGGTEQSIQAVERQSSGGIEPVAPEFKTDFASTQLEDSLAFEVEEDRPDFASTQLVDSLDFGDGGPAPDLVSAPLGDRLDFGVPAHATDFEHTTLSGGQRDGDFSEKQDDHVDFAATQTFDFDALEALMGAQEERKTEAPPESVDAAEHDLGEFDFDTLDTLEHESPVTVIPELDLPEDLAVLVESEAQSEVPLDHLEFPPEADNEDAPAVEPVAVLEQAAPEEVVDLEEGDEQTKVIGALRLSIPLYNVYLNEADEWSRRLQVELSEWSLELHQPLPDAAVTLAHSLGGSSATVGFVALSEMARTLEHALQHVQLYRQGRPEHAQIFVNAGEDIRRLLHQFAAGFLKAPNASILEELRAIIDTEFPAPVLEDRSDELDEVDDVDEIDDLVDLGDGVDLADLTALDETDDLADAVDTQVPVDLVPVAKAPLFSAAVDAVPAPLTLVDADDDDIDAVDRLDADLFPIFEEEGQELLPQLGGALRQWVARPDNLSARSEVLRVLHTLKGSSRLAGALRLGEMTHRMESSIERIGSENLQSVQIEPLLTRFDSLQSTFQQLGAPQEAETPAARDEMASAASTREAPPLTPTDASAGSAAVQLRQSGSQSVRVRSQLLDRLVNQAGEVMITRSRMDARLSQFRASLGELGGNLDRLRQQLRDVEVQAESQMQSRLAQTKDSSQAFDPLEFDRFTRLQELTRMMAESVNDVATVQRNLQRSVEGTEDDLIAQGRQARELHRDLLRTRMVEFEAISERLYGVVRQAGKDTGKLVKLDIVGGSIDMDRGVLERMAPAFEHLLRNSVAHGIESAAIRDEAGKPAVGTITIQVSQMSNDVSVAFSDDGGGLHLEKIRAKAIANGVISSVASLSEDQAAQLIFAPGFSTADQVTEVSGRGIGMDVVRSEVNALGGRIETTSQPGLGTTFKLILPLTTAVTQVVMMRMGEFTIGVPSNLMETVLRVPSSALETAYQANGFDMAGNIIPFFWAGALLQVSARSNETQTKTLPVAVFRSAGQRLALHVDEVLGNREVVVKNLGPQLGRLPGLAGVSVLASGAVVLIYNPVALAAVYGEQAQQLRSTAMADAALATVEQNNTPATGSGMVGAVNQVPLVLVVDDSITVRRVTQRLLKREGYRVSMAADGLQALEKLQEERPAVVLSDIEMPRMDGFDLARNIRGDERLRDLPIIMITSRIAEKHREHAKELGVDHYLGKPYSEEELLGLVRSYCFTDGEA